MNRGGSRALRLTVTAAIAAAALAAAAPASADVKWVCKPGQVPNVCRESLTTTVYEPGGSSRVLASRLPADRPIDCFYVYPTVSNQPGPNASKSIDPEIEGIVRYQAQRFSQQCRVYAPVYRQVTVSALAGQATLNTPAARNIAYGDVLEAWRDYMKNHNKGRGVVLLGHSQGTRVLRRLLRNKIDSNPAVRRQLVSAVLLGGNVLVKAGSRVGGDFKNVPACSSATQFGCVIAFSLFNETPPDNARFGRPPPEPDPASGDPGGPGFEVLCTNPGSLGPNREVGSHTLIPSRPFPPGFIRLVILQLYGGEPPTAPTPWLRPADRYSGRCEKRNGANVLFVRPIGSARKLNPAPDDTWGLHIVDMNAALGDLQAIVAAQSGAYRRASAKRKARIKLKLRSRRGRDARGRRCARLPIRASIAGRDRRRVERVSFRAGRRVLKRDRSFPFKVKLRAPRLRGGQVVRFGARVLMADGRRVRIAGRRVRVCG